MAAETHLAEKTDLEIMIHSKSRAVFDRPRRYAQTNCIQNRWATNFSFKNINNEKGIKMPPSLNTVLKNLI
jgi:hypothetical protein